MFTCLEVVPQKTSLFNRIGEFIKPPLPQREFVQVKGGTPFLRLKVRENHMDWQRISALLIKNERNLILPEFVSIPENVTTLNICKPYSLGLNMMFCVMCDTLNKINQSQKISVSVFDKDAHLKKTIEKIVPFVRNISVFTEKIPEYFSVSQRIMGEWGLSIKINEYESFAESEKIILADKYLPRMKTADFVFTADSQVCFNAVTGNSIILENEYRTLKSHAIDDFLFASCLYEYNNAKHLADMGFVRLRFSGKSTDIEKLANLIGNGEIA